MIYFEKMAIKFESTTMKMQNELLIIESPRKNDDLFEGSHLLTAGVPGI